MTRTFETLYRFRAFIVLVLVALAYGGSLDVPYYFDDVHSIRDNTALRDWSSWNQFWINPELTSTLPANRSYRPLTFTLYNFLSVIGNGAPLPFHLYKLLLLFGICMLVEAIWTRLSNERFLGFTLACMWAVHPALSESSIYLTATSSQQAALFYFLAFWFYLKNPNHLIPVVLCYAASCFSKEEGITLPAIIALYEISRGRWKQRFNRIAVISLAGVALSLFIQTRIPAEQSVSRGTVPVSQYFYTQIRAWLHYQWLWIWPQDLNADNTHFGFSASLSDPKVLLSAGIQLIVTIALWLKRKSAPLLIFGWLWYYLSISPASSFIPLAEPVNERRMLIAYLGFTGVIHLLAWNGVKANFKKWLFVTWIVWMVGATTITVRRVQVWRNPILLWSDVVAKNPGSVRALNNLASEKINRGDFENALADVKKCLEIQDYLYCRINEGVIYLQLRRYPEALNSLEHAASHSQGVAEPHFYLAYYWFERGDYSQALIEVDRALAISRGTHSPSRDLKEQILRARGERP